MDRCRHTNGDVNVLALTKPAATAVAKAEHYVFLYGDDRLPDLVRTLGRFAADADLNFTWYDAAVLSAKAQALPGGGKDVQAGKA